MPSAPRPAPACPVAGRIATALIGCWLLASPLLTRAAPDASAAAPPLKPITSLDLPRYMGRWYELARYPNRFQRQCAGAAMATYSLLPAGTVQVVNRCPQADGQVDEAMGEARRIGPEGSATLQVRFAPAWLSFLPLVWGDYWVVELDDAYQLAVISEPRREYLWVLSRQPSLPPAAWAAMTVRLQAQGFDPARLWRASP
jgi:apolipoprotein D and lipocalin family protein